MKKLNLQLWSMSMFILSAILMSSCNSGDDIIGSDIPAKPESNLIYFTGELGNKGGSSSLARVQGPLRVVSDPDNGTLNVKWEKGEKVALVYAVSGIKYIRVAEVTSISNGVAKVEGTLEGSPADNTPVKIVYPYAAADKDTESGIKADYLKTGQDGTLKTISDKYDVATGDGNLAVSGTKASFKEMASLANQYAICKFTFKSNDTQITGIKKLVISDEAGTNVLSTVNCSNRDQIYLAIDPSITGRKKFVAYNLSDNILKEYTGYATPKLTAGIFYRPTLTLPTSEDTGIDLGTGVIWANRNVGADKPEDYGDMFAWGETVGYSSVKQSPMTDHNFNWESYKWSGNTSTSLTKYCLFSSSGTVDNKKVLDPEDDAATANWGPAWRMPTCEDFQALLKAFPFSDWGKPATGKAGCYWKNDYSGNIKGLAFQDKSGNLVFFLPCAGHRHDDTLSHQGTYGRYWSSSLYPYASYQACAMDFYTGEADENYRTDRRYGLSVRPVFVME